MGKKREASFVISAENKTAQAFARITGDLKGLKSEFGSFHKFAAGAVTAVVGSAAVKGFASMIQRANDLTDSLRDSSIRLGIGIADLQGYQLAAGNAGIEAGKLEASINKLNKVSGEVKLGTVADKTIEAFGMIGVSVDEIRNSSPAEVFEQVIDGLGGITDPAARAAIAMQLFGKSGAAMLTLVADGAGSLREARQLLDDLGLSLTEIDGRNVDAANDAIGTLSVVADAAKQKFAAELSPAIAATANMLLEAGKNGETMGLQISAGAQATVTALDAVINSARFIGNSFAAGFDLVQAAVSGGAAAVLGFTADFVTAIGTTAPNAFNDLLKATEDGLTYMKQGFADLATVIANAFVSAVNGAIGAVEKLVNTTAEGLNAVITTANSVAGTNFSTIPTVSFGRASGFDRFPVDRVDLGRVGTFGEGAAQSLGDWSNTYGRYANEQLQDAGGDIRDAALAADSFINGSGPLGDALQEAKDYANELTGAIDPDSLPAGGGSGGGKGAKGAMKKLKKASEETGTAIENTFSILEEYGKSVTSNIEKAIDDFVRNGELSMKDFARSILVDLAAITAKAAILGGIFGNSEYGGNGSGLVGSLVSGFMSGFSGAPKAIPVNSYAGGGFTGFGSRSGGIDGQGGFPAILHPNETVVDHTRSGGESSGDITIQQTIVVRETLPASIAASIVKQSVGAAQAAMRDVRDRGGSRRKAYGLS